MNPEVNNHTESPPQEKVDSVSKKEYIKCDENRRNSLLNDVFSNINFEPDKDVIDVIKILTCNRRNDGIKVSAALAVGSLACGLIGSQTSSWYRYVFCATSLFGAYLCIEGISGIIKRQRELSVLRQAANDTDDENNKKNINLLGVNMICEMFKNISVEESCPANEEPCPAKKIKKYGLYYTKNKPNTFYFDFEKDAFDTTKKFFRITGLLEKNFNGSDWTLRLEE